MKNFKVRIIILLSCWALARSAAADDSCKSPSPLFGKIVAICGDQMITYVGDQQKEILGIPTTTSRFELAYCSTGGGRKGLSMESHSAGYVLKSEVYLRGDIREFYEIHRNGSYRISDDLTVFSNFRMTGTDYDGNPINVPCTDFNDTREDIEYLKFYF